MIPDSAARIRLFCFPYAGGSSAAFRNWGRELQRTSEVAPALLPGREARMREAAYVRHDKLVESFAREIVPFLDKRFALFGHSMGAIIAFELARRLRDERGIEPKHLFIAGRRSPRAPRRDPYIHDMPDAEFIAEIGRMNGTPREVLEHKELMALIMPMLRADFAVCHSYVYEPGEPLRCPITVLGGTRDEMTTEEELAAWKDETTGVFRLHMLDGDHFFIHEQQPAILKIVEEDLRTHI